MDQNFEKSGFQGKISRSEHGISWKDLNPAHDKGRNRFLNLIQELIPPREDWLAARRGVLITAAGLSVVIGSLILGNMSKAQIEDTAIAVFQPRPDTSQIIIPPEQLTTQNSFTKFLMPTTYSSDGKNVIKPIPSVINAENEYTKKQAEQERQTFLAPKGEALLRYANVQQWSSQIDKAINDPRIGIKAEEKENMRKLVSLVIGYESGGNREAISNAKAYGLCQIKDAAAQQAAQYLGIKSYNPWDTETNILLATAYLQNLRRSQPSIAMVLTEYNVGSGIMIGSQRAYLAEKREAYKINPDKLERGYDTFGINGQDHPATWVYDVFYSVTLKELRESPAVQAYLKEHNIDSKEFGQGYYRTVALAAAWHYIKPS